MSAKENVAVSFDDERQTIPSRRLPPIPADKLHRRNPHTVRQELKMLDDFVPDTTLADVQLSEMPGLQNTEQWKRIAGRTVHPSPPLSRQYYQTVVSTLELQDGQIPQPLGSYRRPGRSENEQNLPSITTSPWSTSRRRVIISSSVAVVIVAIVVSVVLAVTLTASSDRITSDYYEGSIYVRANFDPLLLDPTSTLVRDYKKEFCALVRRTLVGGKTKYARSYSTCSVIAFRNGSIIADFVLGFKRSYNVTRLNSYLNRTLVNQELFGGSILSIEFNITAFDINNNNNTNNNTTQTIDIYDEDDDDDDDDDDDNDDDNNDDPNNSGKFIMNDQNLINEPEQPTQTSFTTVTYKTLDKGLSITISETITITNNNNFDKLPINNKNYELILVPTTDNTKTVVVPSGGTNEKTVLPPPTTTTTNLVTKSPSSPHLLRPIKPISDTNFAYIDDSSDDRTISSGNATSTLEDLTTRDSTTSASTSSLDEGTLTNSTSTIANNVAITTATTSNQPLNQNRPLKTKDENSNEKQLFSSRSNPNVIKRQRRVVIPKKHRRLLQYELMPTGKIYYVDRSFYNESKKSKDDNDSNSSIVLSTVISRSSSVDTLSDKRYRHRHHHHHHHQQQQQQQQNRKYYPNLSLKKPEQKLSVAGRLASNNNLTTTTSPFKPISSNTKKKRFSSFEPTPESLDRVFDVLIAADKRREEHEFWREKFDHRTITSRSLTSNSRTHDATTNSNTIPVLHTKQAQLNVNSNLNNTDNRSQSYTTKRNSSYDTYNRQRGCLLEDCLRRRTLIIQQQQQQQKLQQLQPSRNYSPNTIYSTNYPKQQLPPTGKPPPSTVTTTTTATATNNQQPVRIFPLSNGRVGRAPQARQTSDELSSQSDVWATRSSLEDEFHHPKKSTNHTRFQSAVHRNRINDPKILNNKRASSVEQQKPNRTQNKNLTTKSKFFDLFKFTR
ncbi:unnamed protein product [Rotaria sp. Silwood1]|nr:unnamed protein product [Rotaria sp. Silwood1]CAF3334371.1 unnamed protein product [Rotaria sp. Silwood1]CAF3348428.1 unnamed protein product [Rotaria sp. Silwood1]